MKDSPADTHPPTALCIAHPGHEVRIHHWLETRRPVVFVLTDGSGGRGVSRLERSRQVIEACGAQCSSVFGRFTDRELYAVIREGNIKAVLDLAEELARLWHALGITQVAADMLEGFNTGHDLCHWLTAAVVERLQRRHQRDILHHDFPLEASPERMLSLSPENALVLDLDDSAFQRKVTAALGYEELATEVERTLQMHGEAPFRREVLRCRPGFGSTEWTASTPPFYETYGAKMVAAGRYQDLITFQQNMKPLALALWQWASQPI